MRDRPHLHLGGERTLVAGTPLCIATTAQLDEVINALANLADGGRDELQIRIRTSPPTVDRATLGRFFAEVLQISCDATHSSANRVIPQPLNSLQVLTLHRDSMDPNRFACLCSALPYARSIHTLRLQHHDKHFPWKLTKLETSWLAYAIFHPETKHSSWKSLAVGDCRFVGDSMEVLKEMGGNSKDALLSATKLATMMGIHRTKKRKRGERRPLVVRGASQLKPRLAHVKRDAVVHVAPDHEASQLGVLPNEACLETCDFHFDAWCCVLLPGYGFGWVHQDNVTGVKDWAIVSNLSPNSSPLTALELGHSISMGTGLLLLAATGQSLETLTLKISLVPSNILDDIARLCPHLKSLVVQSRRRTLSGRTLRHYFCQRSTRHLRSFSVNWSICNHDALLEVLSNATHYPAVALLKELRISKATYLDRFARMLAANKTLEQIHLEGWYGLNGGLLQQFDGEILPNEKNRFAFLSVVSRLSVSEKTILCSFTNQDLLSLIFEFAAARRVVVV